VQLSRIPIALAAWVQMLATSLSRHHTLPHSIA
jgi:hypothetical protein